MNYLATTQTAHPSAVLNEDPFANMLLPMDYGLLGSNELHRQGMTQYQTTSNPSLDPFPPLKDPFPDAATASELPPNDAHDLETASIHRDHKLLSFTTPTFDYALHDSLQRRTTIALTAQLHGMFFLAESPWVSAGELSLQPPPKKLTCYRRNLFQVTGEITLPKTLKYISTAQGGGVPIIGQELAVSAIESTEGTEVRVISVPWKAHEDKAEREPAAIPLNPLSASHVDSDFATFPFRWERLQFRTATAHNGRRKELQQHFVVRLQVMATLATGYKVPICQVQSGAIVVRGRSPRNFQSRKDLPLNGSGHVRTASQLAAQSGRIAVPDLTKGRDSVTTSVIDLTSESPAQNVPVQRASLHVQESIASSARSDRHSVSADQHVANISQGEGFRAANSRNSQSEVSRSSMPEPTPSTAPINLSLDENVSPTASNTIDASPPAKRLHIPPRRLSLSLNSVNSPDEDAGQVYEYFPLGLDDWQPPDDAVYRPHFVHHRKLSTDPNDPRTSLKGTRNKRYFSEGVF
ncbi:hypothetical protein MBLNU230_g3713t1 [Neophaeotheca triangularis]